MLIFDWDDTICPSSFVDQWKVEHIRELPLHVRYTEGRKAGRKEGDWDGAIVCREGTKVT